MSSTGQNGKGSAPRNLGKKFRENYDSIDWSKGRKPAPSRKPSFGEILVADYSHEQEKEFDECLRAMMGAIHVTVENRRRDNHP